MPNLGLGCACRPQQRDAVYVGDVDGDGLDDLLIGGLRFGVPPISAADADASFENGQMEVFALGDVNGDGCAEFVLGDATGSEIVFGSRERFTGHHGKFTSGLRWAYPDTPSYRVRPVGDFNGDGADDIALEHSDPSDAQVTLYYLIEGRTAGWPSGTWDPSWATASLLGTGDAILWQTSAGDLDGDGYTDIITNEDTRFFVFYGGAAGLHGRLTPADATAHA